MIDEQKEAIKDEFKSEYSSAFVELSDEVQAQYEQAEFKERKRVRAHIDDEG